MRIGIISDTHLPSLIKQLDELGPQIGAMLETADLILHAGDVTAPTVLDWCQQFAPVKVARGNNDLFEHPEMADHHVLDLLGWRVGLAHEMRPESRPVEELVADAVAGTAVDILIAGDTHVQRLELREGVVLINPGSPTLPHHKEYRLGTAAVLELSERAMSAEILVLGETDGRKNPGRPQSLRVDKRTDGTLVVA